MGQYDDIIHLPHPNSSRHPRMSLLDRAAQFSPFAALTGYEDAIEETGRLTDHRIELNEDARAFLDQKQQLLADAASSRPQVSVTYFQPDHRKSGGAYVTVEGTLKKLDPYDRVLILTDETRIPLSEIVTIESDLFRNIE